MMEDGTSSAAVTTQTAPPAQPAPAATADSMDITLGQQLLEAQHTLQDQLHALQEQVDTEPEDDEPLPPPPEPKFLTRSYLKRICGIQEKKLIDDFTPNINYRRSCERNLQYETKCCRPHSNSHSKITIPSRQDHEAVKGDRRVV